MDIVIDGEAKVQQARLYLKVTEENLKLRKALAQIQEERNSLKEFSAKLESECQDIKNSMSESATEAVALMQADVVEKLQVMESRIDFLNGQVISVTSQLSRKESEKQILMRHHERLLEDNARLKRELEHIYTESTSETIALIEEANSLRETISAQCDEVNDRAKIRSHESTTELQRQVEIKNTMLQGVESNLAASQLLCSELQSKLDRIASEHNEAQQAKVVQLEQARDAQESTLRQLDEVRTQFLDTSRENQELLRKFTEQDIEVQRFRQAAELLQCFVSSPKKPRDASSTTLSTKAVDESESVSQAQRTQSVTTSSRRSADPGPSWITKVLDLSRHATPLSPRREELMNTLPVVNAVPPPGEIYHRFAQRTLAQVLGGHWEGLSITITDPTPLESKSSLNECICPQIEFDVWAPTSPTKHGFMFARLGFDKNDFITPKICELFVGYGGLFTYCGQYEAIQVDALSLEECNTLPEKVKAECSRRTQSWRKRSVTSIRTKYDAGVLLLPCVLLKCLLFNVNFYEDLVAAQAAAVDETIVAPQQGSKRKRETTSGETSAPQATTGCAEAPSGSSGKRAKTTPALDPSQTATREVSLISLPPQLAEASSRQAE